MKSDRGFNSDGSISILSLVYWVVRGISASMLARRGLISSSPSSCFSDVSSNPPLIDLLTDPTSSESTLNIEMCVRVGLAGGFSLGGSWRMLCEAVTVVYKKARPRSCLEGLSDYYSSSSGSSRSEGR